MAKKKSGAAAVIGAGFSGLCAAVSLKRLLPDCVVTVYEALPRPGKKILVTGNGRCNVTNREVSAAFYNGDAALFESVYSRADNTALLAFFGSLGLRCRQDFAGRYYPASNQAFSVRDALLREAESLGIEIMTDCRVESIERAGAGWLLNGEYRADAALFATGGLAAPVQGSDGSGIELLRAAGVGFTPMYPSLVPLYVAGFTKSLKGVRAQGRISVLSAGRVLASDEGELQYTEKGLSGIPAFQVSGTAARALGEGKNPVAVVDSAPFMNEKEVADYIIETARRYPGARAEGLLEGIMPAKLGAYLMKECSLNPEKNMSTVSAGAAAKLAAAVKAKKYRIEATGGYADAQVTAGGIASREIDTATLGIKKLPGVFACGEILDVDGLCGGYNLQWAFSSAVVAARGMARVINDAAH